MAQILTRHKQIPGLFLYESYGIMHSEVMKQIHTSYRTTDEWKDFNQAIRSTEEMIISTDNRENGSRKGRHFDDYFIKVSEQSLLDIRTLTVFKAYPSHC